MSAAQPLPTNNSSSAGKRRRELNDPPQGWMKARFYLALTRKSFNRNKAPTHQHGEHGHKRRFTAIQQGKNRGSPFFSVTSVLKLLPGKWREARCVASRHGGSRGVEDHGQQRVIPGDADDVDHALLAKGGDGARVSGVADALISMQLVAEGVQHVFVGGHFLGPASFGNRLDDVRRESSLERQLIVR